MTDDSAAAAAATGLAGTRGQPASKHRRVSAHLPEGWRDGLPPEWIEHWAPQPFELAGGLTDIVVMGEGRPLVLIPPLPGFKEAWVATAARLARSFRVIVYDLRVRFGGPPSWSQTLDDLDRIVAAHAPEGGVTLVGHSLGGAVAQQWALSRPGRVRALVLSSSFLKVSNPASNWYARFVEQPFLIATQRGLSRPGALAVARALARNRRWVYDLRCDDRLLDFVRFCMRSCDGETVRSAVRLAIAHDTRRTAGTLDCPTLVVVGEREGGFYRPAAAELARAIPGATLEVSPEVSHLHLLSSPDWLAETITSWIRRSE